MATHHPATTEALGRALHRAITTLAQKELNGSSAKLGAHLNRALAAEGLEVHCTDDTVRLAVLRLAEAEHSNGA